MPRQAVVAATKLATMCRTHAFTQDKGSPRHARNSSDQFELTDFVAIENSFNVLTCKMITVLFLIQKENHTSTTERS